VLARAIGIGQLGASQPYQHVGICMGEFARMMAAIVMEDPAQTVVIHVDETVVPEAIDSS
jgi:hypothetical protein